VDAVIPVDVYIPGCPPRPEALLHGILLALGQVRQRVARARLLADEPPAQPKPAGANT